jgi:hypothetical protein
MMSTGLVVTSMIASGACSTMLQTTSRKIAALRSSSCRRVSPAAAHPGGNDHDPAAGRSA